MKTLIIASGNLGTVVEIAYMLKEELGPLADVIDTGSGIKIFEPDYEAYDVIVFGTNIRASRPNKRFVKWAKKTRKILKNKTVYAYISNVSHDIANLEKVDRYLPDAKAIYDVGGVVHVERTKGIMQNICYSLLLNFENRGLPKPTIDVEQVKNLAFEIINGSQRVIDGDLSNFKNNEEVVSK